MIILQNAVILVVSTGFGDDQYLGWGGGGGGMVVAFMYPASRIDVKPINCKHTSILVDNTQQLAFLVYVIFTIHCLY